MEEIIKINGQFSCNFSSQEIHDILKSIHAAFKENDTILHNRIVSFSNKDNNFNSSKKGILYNSLSHEFMKCDEKFESLIKHFKLLINIQKNRRF